MITQRLKIQTYVVFLHPGIIVSESSSHEVESRDETILDIPKNAYAFSFHDVLSLRIEADDGSYVELRSNPINKSPLTYVKGKVTTIEEVKATQPHERIQILNMEGNGYDRVIDTGMGTFPFRDGEKVLNETSS